jgi:hypothetical protein
MPGPNCSSVETIRLRAFSAPRGSTHLTSTTSRARAR